MKGYWRRGAFLLLSAATWSGWAGCKQRGDDAVARSYDTYLYRTDLAGIVPEGVTGEDSVKLARAYIDQWLRQQAVLVQAQRNVKANSERIEKQVEEYRNGLIVYEYEQALISQKLDTVVTDQEISDYYDAHKELFILTRPILQTSYIHLKTDAPEIDRVKRLFVSEDLSDKDLLDQYCQRYAISYSLYDRDWHYADGLQQFFPIGKISESDFSQTGRIFEIIENNELYLIILHDARFSDSRSPLLLEQDNIRNLILNKRKVDLLAQMQKSIVDDARAKNKIETFD